MLNLESINREILDLEKKDTSYAVLERLSWLYTVRDHIMPEPEQPVTGKYSGSEFMRAVSGVDLEAALGVLSEHLEAVKVIYPEEYKSVLERIQALKR